MSWSDTYAEHLAVGVDYLADLVIWNQEDITISSLCRMWRLNNAAGFKLNRWQLFVLSRIEPALEWLSPGHCERARLADIAQAESTIAKLRIGEA